MQQVVQNYNKLHKNYLLDNLKEIKDEQEENFIIDDEEEN